MTGMFISCSYHVSSKHPLPPLYHSRHIAITLLVSFQPMSVSDKFCEEKGNHVLSVRLMALSTSPSTISGRD